MHPAMLLDYVMADQEAPMRTEMVTKQTRPKAH